MKASHGYDNELDDMKSFLVARGPDFQCNYKQSSLSVTDIYTLMCSVLGLQTCHENSGSLESSQGMVTKETNSCLLSNRASATLVMSTSSIVTSAVFLALAILKFVV